MNFNIKFSNAKTIKALTEMLVSAIGETELNITKDSFIIKAMDESRIALLKLEVKKEGFEEYKCEKESKISLSLTDLDKILKRASSNESVEFIYNEADQKLKIKMKDRRTRTFSLALLDTEFEEIPISNLLQLDYDSEFKMDGEFLEEALKDAEIYSEIISIKAKEEGLVLSSSGQIGEMEYELSKEDLTEYICESEQVSSYSIHYLKMLTKVLSITENLKIYIKTDHPLRLDFDIIDETKLDYFLAPRVEDTSFDDEDVEEF